jgi:two-component system response regulator (stage 0 sporulation protein F)
LARILVADDDESLRGLLRHVLEGWGHEVLAASDGALALARARLQPPDLFLCDVFMAEMDGLEAIREFRAAFPGVPIVAISGAALGGRLDMLHVAKMLGASRVLPKPFSMTDLGDILADLLRPVGATVG